MSFSSSTPPPPPSPIPALRATGLRKTYGDLVALGGVDLTVLPGESVAIMGASGSGKTTLLHCLAAIIAPDAGSILLRTPTGEERELAALSENERSTVRRQHLGFVFQDHLLLPELTAVENVALPLLLLGVARAEAEARAAAWLTWLGLAGMENRRIGQLSGGQAQRVAIARAHVTGAAIVFADEPTGALDSVTSTEVLDALLRGAEGTARSLVLVTHDAAVAARCDRVLHMRDGRFVNDAVTGTPGTTSEAHR